MSIPYEPLVQFYNFEFKIKEGTEDLEFITEDQVKVLCSMGTLLLRFS